MHIDLSGVSIEPLADSDSVLHGTLHDVLTRIAPFTATTPGLSAENRIRQLGAAINVTADALEKYTGMMDARRLPDLIERVADLAVTGDNLEVQIGVAGDLRVDKRRRLVVDDVLLSLLRVPAATRPAAAREGITALQRILALLLLHGWTDDMHPEDPARQSARRAIVEAVQGRLYSGQAAL